MKKLLFTIILLTTMPMMMKGQTFSSLWKQVAAAESDDLPQTEQKVLSQIVVKAAAERAYGQLLKAELQRARSICNVAPDSLRPVMERLKQRVEEVEGDVPLQAIYCCVLGYIYQQNSWLDVDRHEEIGLDYYRQALAHPAELAQVKATDYEPFVVEGSDSRYFDHNLLSVVCMHTRNWRPLCDYYEGSGNRAASLLAKLRLIDSDWPTEMEPMESSRFLQRLDSLIGQYQDLPECGEAAITRFTFMNLKSDATDKQKWEYLNDALQRWPKWKRMSRLRNSLNEMTATQFRATGNECLSIPQREQMLQLDELRNVQSITARLYRVKADGEYEGEMNISDYYNKVKPLLTPLPELTRTKQFDARPPYELFKDSIALPPLPVGVYMLEMESQPASTVCRQLLYISDVRALALNLPGDQCRIVMVNATTGQPIAGGKVKVEAGRGNSVKSTVLTCDAKGECTWKKNGRESLVLRPYTDADKFCPRLNMWGNYFYDDKIYNNVQTAVFTDRAIYRPGQTVHAAAIVYTTANGFDHTAVSGQQVRFELIDANFETVSEQTATTDRFGTATVQFTLPSKGLTGNYRLHVNNQNHNFRVEEYKRPTFEVDIPQVTDDYKDGDTLSVKATARSYAGVPVQGATVKYKVVRRLAFWWMSYSRYWETGAIGTASNEEVMATGETVTDEQGQFTAEVPLVLPKTKHPMFYHFVLTADVTDQAGENHQGQLSLPLGNRETALSVELDEQVLVENPSKLTFHLRNAAGADMDARVRYRFENEGGAAVTSWLTAPTNAPTALPKLKSGRYKLHAETANAANGTDPLEQTFIIFSLDDKRPAADTREWFYVSNGSVFPADGGPVTVQVGSSDKNVYVVYAFFAGDKQLESGTALLSNEFINRKLSYKEEYGNGLLMTYAWMKEGKMHQFTNTIGRPIPNKRLKLTWQTFRDRLTPGQQEEWTLSITDANGERLGKAAQLMATLYDKSLDQLSGTRSWRFVPINRVPTPSTSWMGGNWRNIFLFANGKLEWEQVYDIDFSHFNTNVLPSYIDMRMKRRLRGAGLPVMMKMQSDNNRLAEVVYSAEESSANQSVSMDEALQGRIAGLDIVHYKLQDLGGEGQQPAEMQLRENLQETAFFMPQLLADSAGIVKMKFTLPESLTTWCFLGVAHTEDMMYGQIEGEAVASKDMMIQPNMPRFLRQGDEGTISARVVNMSDEVQSGTAILQLLDPETEQVLMEQKQQVTIAAGNTSSVSFSVRPNSLNNLNNPISPNEGLPSLLIARVSISTAKHSDGEQHYLPVLPNTERVTVTVPFTQTAPGTKTIDLKHLVPVDDPQAMLTVEYTNNPAWLMIQALPTVGHPHDDCAICQATSFYAYSIGRHILKQNPTAKHVFEQWKQEENTAASSLQSSLQKDQELKDLLLNETPWVMDANREEEQKQRLADFFDANTIGSQIDEAIDKLGKLQNGDGSWSWWPGMKGSTHITTAVAEILVRLNQMTGQQDDTKKMLASAFGFLGDDIVEMVNEMKKEERKGHKQLFPSHRALQWLYICALDGRQLPATVNEANTYLKNLLKKDTKNQTILEKALSAIVLNDKKYIKSLKEWTVYKEEMGRYYDTQRAGYSWRDYKIPTQVAAIEALKRLTPQDTETITEMQRWLLQQKRNQAWDTPLNSVDAIYVFLDGNSQALAPQQKTVLAIDGTPIATSTATAGIGYVKTAQAYNGQTTFTAEKTSTGTSWGAVYAQFTQPARDISDQQSGLSVKREIRRNNPSETLKVGDRVTVRLTIEADRDYDFVQLVDRRAACMEPVKQLSGYNWREGYYCAPKDNSTSYFFDLLPKGRHIIETEYYIDREGVYETGSCTVQCAYSPEFRGTTKGITVRSAALR